MMWETLTSDLRHAARSLRRAPAFTLTATTTLGIALGAVIAIATVTNAVLLRPLPYPDSERLVGVWNDFPPIKLFHGGQAAISYLAFESRARTLDGIGIYKEGAVNLSGDPAQGEELVAPRRVTSASASATLFTTLGVSALRGRVYGAAEDRAGASPVVLISEGLWRSQLGADSAVVGRMLDVNGVKREIVGVMPASFRFPSSATSLWLPLSLDPANPPADAFTYNAVGRLKAGVTLSVAQRDLAVVFQQLPELYPTFVPGISTRQILAQTRPRPVVTPFRQDVAGRVAGPLWMITVATGLLLLVACFNVANLTIIRFDGRQRELAVRAAIGGGRARIARFYACESLWIAAAAALAGSLLAYGLVQGLVALAPAGIPRLAEISIDLPVVSLTLALAIAAGAACASVPAWRVWRDTTFTLHAGARGGTATKRQHRLRNTFVAAQIALTLMVLAAAGLLERSFQRLHAVRLGFDPQDVTAFWVSLPRGRYANDRQVVQFYSRMVQRVSALPGVAGAGVSSRLPLLNRGVNENPIYPEDAPQYTTSLPPLQVFGNVGGDYFRTMRIPVLAGRDFDPLGQQRDYEAIVSSRTAALFWGDSTGRAALGKRFRALPTDPWYTVVGVVGNTHDTTLATAPSPDVYFPEAVHQGIGASHTGRTVALVVRSRVDPAALTATVQHIVSDIDPTLPIFDARAMTDVVGASTAQLAFTMLLLVGAAIVTLVIGGVGLYGAIAYMVSLRRRELGIRIALGASPRSLAAATTWSAVKLTMVGAAAGLLLFAFTVPLIRAFLFGVTSWDPLALAGALGLLVAMAAIASYMPARRVSLVDSTEALRAE